MTSTKTLDQKAVLVVSKVGAKYNPNSSTAQDNAASWAAIKDLVGTKGATYGDLQKALKEKYNHAPMVGYCVRRGWLVAK